MLTCQGTRQQSSTFTKHKITAQQEGQEAVVEEVEEEAVVTAFLSWLAVVRPSRTTSSSDLKTTT